MFNRTGLAKSWRGLQAARANPACGMGSIPATRIALKRAGLKGKDLEFRWDIRSAQPAALLPVKRHTNCKGECRVHLCSGQVHAIGERAFSVETAGAVLVLQYECGL